MIYELGHALGFKHPFDIVGSAPTFPGVPEGDAVAPGSNDLNHMLFTDMSYIQSYHFDVLGRLVFDQNHAVVNGQLDYGYASTPMAFDIAAVQYLYGVNTTYRTGNDVYLRLRRETSSAPSPPAGLPSGMRAAPIPSNTMDPATPSSICARRRWMTCRPAAAF